MKKGVVGGSCFLVKEVVGGSPFFNFVGGSCMIISLVVLAVLYFICFVSGSCFSKVRCTVLLLFQTVGGSCSEKVVVGGSCITS